MQHSDLKEHISSNLPFVLSDTGRINNVVEQLGKTKGSVKDNVASMENKLADLVGYKKGVQIPHEVKIQRVFNSRMIKQAIAEAELDIWFNRRNHEQATRYTGKRYMGMLYSLYGNEPEMENFVSKTPEEQVNFYVSKLDKALEKFPKITAPDVSDQEIVENFSTILDLYYLTSDLDYAHALFDQHPQGQELYDKYIAFQNHAALLNARAFLLANPYYSEMDFDQLLRTPITEQLEDLVDHADNMDDALKDAIYSASYVQHNLKECRQQTLDQLLPKEGEGTVEYFNGNAKPMDQEEKNAVLSVGLPLLAKITGQDGTVSVKAFLPSSTFSTNMEELTPEQYLDYVRKTKPMELADLSSVLEKSHSFFRGGSDQFDSMCSAFERLHNHNLFSTPSTQNLLSSKDALEELLESANAYLQFKAQSRAGTDAVQDYSKLGKNEYEQTRINAALKLREYAQSKLDVYNLLQEDGAFKARAAANEEALRNAPKDSTQKDIANLRAVCVQRHQDSWAVREGGENVAKLHHTVGRDLRKLAEFACLDRPLDSSEKAEIRTRMARAVALDLIRTERASSQSTDMGTLERTAAQNPEKFAAGIAKSKPFQKMMDHLTPEKLNSILSENGIQNICQSMLTASVAGKTQAPAQAQPAVQPPEVSGPIV